MSDSDTNCIDEVPLPALLRAARDVYRREVPIAHASAGYEDMPANGTFVLGALRRFQTPVGQIIRELGITKQAAGQLFDTLVLRGYLTRTTDQDDRRRMILELTERGTAASIASGERIDAIERQLEAKVGVDAIRTTRRTLAALIEDFRPPE